MEVIKLSCVVVLDSERYPYTTAAAAAEGEGHVTDSAMSAWSMSERATVHSSSLPNLGPCKLFCQPGIERSKQKLE